MNNNLGRQGLAIAHPSPDGVMAVTTVCEYMEPTSMW